MRRSIAGDRCETVREPAPVSAILAAAIIVAIGKHFAALDALEAAPVLAEAIMRVQSIDDPVEPYDLGLVGRRWLRVRSLSSPVSG